MYLVHLEPQTLDARVVEGILESVRDDLLSKVPSQAGAS